ncbi:RNA ligase family protein [Streptomyces sp. MI02-2A]|uniref:RNA ligase family protein n=1 Tax=Streptomyces sp. MI02-2A TaxID=3028688 RepID=UPI0029AAEBFF|nr:RNA ligase family protein [Streptomyces sp. MI02-2A]MDX3260737.1 RNA ligase family protein [Streptomyces sp. MI02-2A]
MSDYPKFRSIPRLHRPVVVSEKVDGTNGLIEIVSADDYFQEPIPANRSGYAVNVGEDVYFVFAGSRNRWLSPEEDNFGFCAWVWDNAVELASTLGPGKHYGEWFGQGIQSGYGLDEKRFALFNTDRWFDPRNPGDIGRYLEHFPKAQRVPFIVTVVPVIAVGSGRDLNSTVEYALNTLESEGSVIAPGFMKPEGVVVWHAAARTYFKATIDNDEQPKSVAERMQRAKQDAANLKSLVNSIKDEITV